MEEETGPEVKIEESRETAQSSEAARARSEDPVEEKKKKKDKKRSRKKEKSASEDPGTGERSPENKVRRKRRKSRDDAEGEGPDAEHEGGRTEVKEEDANPGDTPARGVTEEEDLQERIDNFVANNPRSYELGTLPIRDRERRDSPEADPGDTSRRPPEPLHPPRDTTAGERTTTRSEGGDHHNQRRTREGSTGREAGSVATCHGLCTTIGAHGNANAGPKGQSSCPSQGQGQGEGRGGGQARDSGEMCSQAAGRQSRRC